MHSILFRHASGTGAAVALIAVFGVSPRPGYESVHQLRGCMSQ
jgi:hypothetical protein